MMGALGLDSGLMTHRSTVFCPGKYTLGNRDFRCWRWGGHGITDFRKSLVESCDVYYYQVGERLGVSAIGDYAMRCGFGEKTGVELPHERSGNIPTPEERVAVADDVLDRSAAQDLAVDPVVGDGHHLPK